MKISTQLAASLACIALAGPATAQTAGVTPGQWEIAVTINSMEMTGVPAGVARMMVGKTTRVKRCMTPEEAARGPQDLLKADKSCVFKRYSMVNGRLSSEMSCKQGGDVMTAVTEGRFDATSFTATGRSTTTGQMPVTMTSTSIGRWIGECRR